MRNIMVCIPVLLLIQVSMALGFSIQNNRFINKDSPSTCLSRTSKLHSKIFGDFETESQSELSEPFSIASKYFQLEEKEDKESCETDIFLRDDGTVDFSETTGPLPSRVSGHWSQNGDEFELTIKRTFGGGQPGTDVGEFKFDVHRKFIGIIEATGSFMVVNGSMHHMDEFKGDIEVGFFSMIDTTDAKLGNQEEYSEESWP